MSLRAKYVIWYLASLVGPALLFIVGAIFIYTTRAQDKALSITSLYLICFLLFLVSGFIVNYWYSTKLGLAMVYRILAGLSSSIGFCFLMGYDKNLISAIEIIKNSWSLCVKNWKILGKYALLFLVPSIFLTLTGLLDLLLTQYIHSTAFLNFLIMLLMLAAAMVFTLWLSIATAKVIKTLLNNQPIPTIKQTLEENSSLIWPVIWTSIISALIIIGGTLLFLIPGIIFGIWYAFVFYAIIFENQKGLDALRASKSLVVGRWFAILWRITAPALVFGLLSITITSIFQFPLSYLPAGLANNIASSIVSSIVSTLLMPLTATASVVLYLNAKKTGTNSAKSDSPIIL